MTCGTTPPTQAKLHVCATWPGQPAEPLKGFLGPSDAAAALGAIQAHRQGPSAQAYDVQDADVNYML